MDGKAAGAAAADPVAADALAKAEGGRIAAEALAKTAEDALVQAGEALKKVLDERDALAKAHADLLKQLAEANVKLATKGALRVVPVSKADDGRMTPAAPEPTDPLSLIKAAQSRPLTLSR
jgi:uncharacterized protein YciI